ncbi:MAG: signal peptidase I [Bacteroides sp.]|nr:signal peptidase I [Bacteroides sp.]
MIFFCFVWYVFQIFFYDKFITPTESMLPTLLQGDRIIVDKSIAGARIYSDLRFNPKGIDLQSWRMRGRRRIRPNDIVVFNFPHHDDKINFVINNVYAKRCIGVPGDSVAIKDGHFLNTNYKEPLGVEHMQEELAQLPDSLFPYFVMDAIPHDGHIPWTIKNLGPLYLPRKGDFIRLTAKEGCLYRMLLEWETGKSISYDWHTDSVYADGTLLEHYIFDHGYYFMAGDNVSNSNDSRYWGLVPEEYIVGVVTRIAYSIDPSTAKYRKDRILKKPI